MTFVVSSSLQSVEKTGKGPYVSIPIPVSSSFAFSLGRARLLIGTIRSRSGFEIERFSLYSNTEDKSNLTVQEAAGRESRVSEKMCLNLVPRSGKCHFRRC